MNVDEDDNTFLRMIQYFWEEKGDIERYSSFDITRLTALAPDIAYLWKARKEIDAAFSAAMRRL